MHAMPTIWAVSGVWPTRNRRRPAPAGPTAHTPILRTHDRTGRRIDEVDYDPYHWLMARAIGTA
jgi:hypothetical protein